MAAGLTEQELNVDLIFNIFQAAMSRPEPERAEFVRRACSGDALLLAEVERRVRWEERLKGFLLTPVVPRDRVDRPFAPGDVLLDRFEIVRIAGEGGMGVVYEAVDRKLSRRIAVKCPRFEFRKRISPEAIKSIQVTHPNVCRVFEVHTAETNTGDVDFLTMELLEGETLATRLLGAPPRWLESPEAMEIARQICAGLKAVHAEGVIHRDLKPGNIMLSKDGAGRLRAVLMDFGIAQGNEVFSSQVRGTPAYVAPEVWKGRPATAQADIYALGVILYEMASGHLPFAEGTAWEARLEALPAAPRIGQPQRSAVLRCLDPNPQRRFKDVAELEHALRGRLRRWILRGAAATLVTGLAGAIVTERLLPSSAVRIAILPPPMEELSAGESAVLVGFLENVAARLKMLHGVRMPITVFTPKQTSAANLNDAEGTKQLFSASHAILTSLQRNAAGLSIAAELVETKGGSVLQRWRLVPSGKGWTNDLFALEEAVVDATAQRLVLRPEHKEQTLTREAYTDYLQGLYYARFDYDNAAKAVPYFERVIAAAPKSALGYAGLAEAYLGMGDRALVGKAQAAVDQAESLDPTLAQVYLLKGRLGVKMNWYEAALKDLRKAATLDPHDSEIFIEMAYAHYYLEGEGKRETESALRQAIAVEPDNYKPYVDAGQFYALLSDYAAAEKHWLTAVRLAPRQTRSRLNLAELYIAENRLADAESQVVASLEIKKTQSVLATLALLQERTGRPKLAIASYEEALQLGPPSYRIWGSLGQLYQRQQQPNQAAQAYRRGLDRTLEGLRAYPREVDRVAWSAFYYAKLGDRAKAKDAAGLALQMAKSPPADVRRLLVLTYDALNDRRAALAILAGAPPDLLKEFSHSPDISEVLRRDPKFQRLTQSQRNSP